jgi:hypothetical protein
MAGVPGSQRSMEKAMGTSTLSKKKGGSTTLKNKAATADRSHIIHIDACM